MDAPTFFAIINSLLVLALVLVTWKYTRHTRRLADTAKRQFDVMNKQLSELQKDRKIELLKEKLSQAYGPLYSFIQSMGYQLFQGKEYNDKNLEDKFLESGDQPHGITFDKKILQRIFHSFPYLVNEKLLEYWFVIERESGVTTIKLPKNNKTLQWIKIIEEDYEKFKSELLKIQRESYEKSE